MKPGTSLSLSLLGAFSGSAAAFEPACSFSRNTNAIAMQGRSSFFSSKPGSCVPHSFPGTTNHNSVDRIFRGRSAAAPITRAQMISPDIASFLAGSAAGAVGVGVAFPLDTLKTKSQVMGQNLKENENTDWSALASSASATAVSTKYADDVNGSIVNPSQLGMLSLIMLVWQAEGIAGFFSGVRAMMAGQAVIKAVAFSANSFALTFLNDHALAITSVVALVVAAAFSGFVTSFLVAPVERIKVMMQASGSSMYKNEIECIQAVVESEGFTGLFGRGLGPTLAREIPSYAIYFVVYGLLMQTAVASMLGGAAPLVFGAMSGCACWIPVYPIDVVKTLVQNTEGGGAQKSTWEVATDLYAEGGVGAFFDGLTPKMLRAAVNHSVTFFMYDLVMRTLAAGNSA